MKRFPVLIIILALALTSCGKKDDKPKVPANLPASKLSILAIQQFRSSGLEAIITREFSRLYNCSITTTTYPTSIELMEAASSDSCIADLVIGIPGSFAYGDSLDQYFLPVKDLQVNKFSRELSYDPADPLIPYGFANLAIVYNERQIDIPPTTFGDLQDARYISQMAICDPNVSGLGRSSLIWTRALFGEDGFRMLWLSLRKNIGKKLEAPEEGLKALESGQYAMIIGLNTYSAWLKEQDPNLDYFKSVIPGEGSFIYTEHTAIHKNSANPKIAKAFIEYLISPGSQKTMVYKLGLFPANSTTELPLSFARIPIYSHSTHHKLDKTAINEGIKGWLDFWNDLTNFRIN